MPKVLIHDWDDTVTNSFQAYTPFYYNFAKFHHVPKKSVEDLKKNWGKPIVKILNGLYPEINESEMQLMLDDFIKNGSHNYEVKILDGVKEVLIKLRKSVTKLGF